MRFTKQKGKELWRWRARRARCGRLVRPQSPVVPRVEPCAVTFVISLHARARACVRMRASRARPRACTHTPPRVGGRGCAPAHAGALARARTSTRASLVCFSPEEVKEEVDPIQPAGILRKHSAIRSNMQVNCCRLEAYIPVPRSRYSVARGCEAAPALHLTRVMLCKLSENSRIRRPIWKSRGTSGCGNPVLRFSRTVLSRVISSGRTNVS